VTPRCPASVLPLFPYFFKDPYIIRVSSNTRLWWDFSIILFALYNAITIPLSLAFTEMNFDKVGLMIFDSFVDLIFFVDILITFRTTYISTKTGDEIYNPRLIAKQYVMGGRFAIDLISSIPMDKLGGGNDMLSIFGMLKLFRIFRMSQVIRNMNVKRSLKAVRTRFPSHSYRL